MGTNKTVDGGAYKLDEQLLSDVDRARAHERRLARDLEEARGTTKHASAALGGSFLGIGPACPEWCHLSGDPVHQWEWFDSEGAPGRRGFTRRHEGIKGDWFLEQFDLVLVSGERELGDLRRSKTCYLLSFGRAAWGKTVAEVLALRVAA